MRKAVLVVLSALTLVIGMASLADAAKPAYKVTIRTSAASSTADHFITVSGKVTGPKAAGKSVTIQRHYLGGPWVTVTSAVIRHNGSYAAQVETPRGGTTSFRAIKARSSARSAGVSATRSIPVYRWLYLSDQPGETSNSIRGVDEVIGGRHYPHSIDYFSNDSSGSGYMEFKFGNLCTRLTTEAHYLAESPAATPADATLTIGRWNGASNTSSDTVVSTGTPVPINLSEVGTMFRYLNLSGAESGYRMTLLDPKVYCNAEVLPTWRESEVD